MEARKKVLYDDIAFWTNKLQADTGNFVFALELAGLQLSVFHLTGEIGSLHQADSLMIQSARALNFTDPEMLQSLSQLSITRHQFAQAHVFNEAAKKKSASPFIYSLIRFDTEMELGRYAKAEESLHKIADEQSFHYMIRKAKQKDHQGDLEGAIALMETAFEKIAASGNASLYCWTLSNLGDMYGHAGRIGESYNAYISVLKKDPTYLYALKGIAWIAYSHDRDPVLARRITDFIMLHNTSPDYHLFQAELAEFTGEQESAKRSRNSFMDEVAQPAYGDMYNKYLIELYCEDPGQIDKALILAEKEVRSRPTPETFSWLAWVQYKKGNYQVAARLFQNHVLGMTSEPEPLLKGFYILKKAGKSSGAIALKKEAVNAEFELGPLAMKELREGKD